MIELLRARLRQGHRTIAYPHGSAPELPELFRGRPRFEESRCAADCRACAEACPTSAIEIVDGPLPATDNARAGRKPASESANREAGAASENSEHAPGAAGEPEVPGSNRRGRIHLDLGRCLFCDDCRRACPEGAISHERNHRLAVRHRDDLRLGPEELRLADALEEKIRSVLGRALCLRVVSAGGCGACEADTNVLTTIGWDIGRFGIRYVASPRHADGLLITGPVTANMREALRKTYDAIPSPKIVIAVGACAISGGPFAGLSGSAPEGIATSTGGGLESGPARDPGAAGAEQSFPLTSTCRVVRHTLSRSSTVC